MILRNALCLLSIFLFFSPVKAMENPADQEPTLEQVTVRIWPESERQISLETKKYYMSLHPFSDVEKITRETFHLKDHPNGFAPSSDGIDRRIQEALDKYYYRKSPPCETFTLMLDPKPMNALWEKLIQNAEPVHSLWEEAVYVEPIRERVPHGYLLKNVQYLITPKNVINSETPPFHYSNITLTEELLYLGNIYNPSTISIEIPKYFEAWLFPIGKPKSAHTDSQNFYEFSQWVKRMSMRQKLVQIHNNIEVENMTYLNKEHEYDIVKILNGQESEEEKVYKIYVEYLPNLQKRFQDGQSYLSLSGWWSWGRGEWKNSK